MIKNTRKEETFTDIMQGDFTSHIYINDFDLARPRSALYISVAVDN